MRSTFRLFGKPRGENIAVVDITSTSVGAAYITLEGIAPPATVFRSRSENKMESASTPGVLRALDTVVRDMTGKGAPLLRKTTGTGSVEEVIVLLGAPWQVAKLEVHTIEKEKPFLFTESMLSEAIAEKGKTGTTTLIASILNGYETTNPVGKRASKAEIVLLTSHIDTEIERLVERAVRGFVGSAPIRFVSFPDVAYQVLRGLFPHQRDFLALRIGTQATELAFVKQSHLAGIETAPTGTTLFTQAAKEHGIVSPGGVSDTESGLIDKEKSARLAGRLAETERAWIEVMRETFIKIAAEGALPRVLFLFSDERSLPFFKRLLDAPELHALWLSDEPLSVIPVGPRHFYQFMRHLGEVPDDAPLDMLSLLSRLS